MFPYCHNGEMTSPSKTGPLAGVRVVELVGLGPAPFAAMMLADLGADVIRVDRPGGGTNLLPWELDVLGRGRPSVVIDLKDPQGVELVLELAENADVLIEGFRPGVMERLGLGPDACHSRNPRLVYGRMTGWGQEGPLAQSAGHDINYIATAGVLDTIGRAGGPPQVPLNLVGDFGGGAMYLVTGVLAALVEARTSGSGQVVDAAIVDGATHLSAMIVGLQSGGAWTHERGTNLFDSGAPYYDVYETSDGKFMSVGALEPQFYAELIRLLGLVDEPDRDDRAAWDDLRTVLSAAFSQKTQAEWIAIFEGSDACVAPVVPLHEAPEHPHIASRGVYVELDGIRQPAPAPRFSRTPTALTTAPARPGQNTREALVAWGIDGVDELIARGIAVQE
ncbi:CaiB/BaiF CoA-transferase family protein [soil metagenome]